MITVVEEQGRDRLPAETLAQLTEVRDLLTGAAGQSPEQARPALEEASGKLDGALSQVETAVDEAPDQLTKIRLLHLQRVLEAIQTSIEDEVRRDRNEGIAADPKRGGRARNARNGGPNGRG